MAERPTEDELIARFFAPLAAAGAAGLRDDAAWMAPAHGCDLVLSADALVAGVHFFADDPPGAIARKALRVNLSDLAAKGAAPRGFLLALMLPENWTVGWLAAFAEGLGADAEQFGCPLLGGDTVRTPGPLTLAVTVLGEVPHGTMVPRTGVRRDDLLYVTGTIGDAALGLWLRAGGDEARMRLEGLRTDERAFLDQRYLQPMPRLGVIAALRAHAHAGMDVSDGLLGDLTKMLTVSGLSGTIDISRVPTSSAAQALIAADPRLLDLALTGGDDYEVLAAVAPDAAALFERACGIAGIAVRRIGVADRSAGQPPVFTDAEGTRRAFGKRSFSHF